MLFKRDITIKIRNKDHGRQVQEFLFEQGYSWPEGSTDFRDFDKSYRAVQVSTDGKMIRVISNSRTTFTSIDFLLSPLKTNHIPINGCIMELNDAAVKELYVYLRSHFNAH